MLYCYVFITGLLSFYQIAELTTDTKDVWPCGIYPDCWTCDYVSFYDLNLF